MSVDPTRTSQDTIRARLEAIRHRHGESLARQDDFLTYSDAEAALRLLDEAQWTTASWETHTHRLIPDPPPEDHAD